MARYRFGVGEYKYFAAPLPEPVAALRTRSTRARARRQPLDDGLDSPSVIRRTRRLPRALAAHGQDRPTPLLLHYTAGGTTASTRISTARSPFRSR